MKKGINLLLRLLIIVGMLLLLLFSVMQFMVFHETTLCGGIFILSGLWGILEEAGVIKRGPFKGKMPLFTSVGAIGLGIYFILR